MFDIFRACLKQPRKTAEGGTGKQWGKHLKNKEK